MSRFGKYVIIALIAAGILAVVFVTRLWKSQEPSSDGKLYPAPQLVLKDYDGRDVALSDFRGRPIVVNAWAAWCPFCVKELPDFAALQEEFRDKIAVVAVDRAESLEVAKKFSDEAGVTGRIILLLDPSDSFYRSIGGFSMPETIFVDAGGMVVDHKRGPMDLDEMRVRTKKAFNL
ncbi:MAG: TlpA family protein disulfide reductase [Candidatus Sungbacteria bacterium]|nr:TlpA family protein disulfide reductase [Parcubacteria group bacterium]MBI2640053.1 TlpA family protein disulfide reductase [Candidatus Sungbacteria bacterium]